MTDGILKSVRACETTGYLDMDGVCPAHGGDSCIARYDHYSENDKLISALSTAWIFTDCEDEEEEGGGGYDGTGVVRYDCGQCAPCVLRAKLEVCGVKSHGSV